MRVSRSLILLAEELVQGTKDCVWVYTGILLVAALALAPVASAQQPADTLSEAAPAGPLLRLVAQPTSDGVVLRWAPATPRAWDVGNEVGYLVERLALEPDGTPAGDFERVVADTLRPWSLDVWEARADPDDRYTAIAAQTLYGERVVPTGSGPYARLRALNSDFENRYGFSLLAADLSATAAEGLALRLTDAAADSSVDAYLYRVFPAAQPESIPIDTAYVRVVPGETGRPAPPIGLYAEVGEAQTTLFWEKRFAGTAYTAYHIERAPGLREEDDPGDGFVRLTELPYLPLEDEAVPTPLAFYSDTTAVSTEDYTYRVYGITPFAALSRPAHLAVPGRDVVAPPAPEIVEGEQVEGTTVRLAWDLPAPPPDLEGFYVGISSDPDGPFSDDAAELLPPSQRTAVDSRALPHTNNYYVVTAVDKAGNRTASSPRFVPLVDTLAPPPLTGLEAAVDTNGVITMTWDPSEALDLRGYRVLQAHSPDAPLVLETGQLVRSSAYVDTLTLESLTKETYYGVVAVDQNNNASELARIRVELPDVVPPSPPVVRGATPRPESVELAWVPSASADVARHLVLRRTAEGQPWEEQAALSGTAEAYTDEAVEQNRKYTYLVVAEDSTGLRSEGGRSVTARPYDTGSRPGVEQLEVETRSGEGIQLTWRYPAPAAGAYWFVVYRAEADGDLRRYRASDDPVFEDFAAREGRTYRYAVQVIYEDGGQSSLSDVVTGSVSE